MYMISRRGFYVKREGKRKKSNGKKQIIMKPTWLALASARASSPS